MNTRELEIKIAKLEALFAGTPYDGEKQAAKKNLERLIAKLHEEQARDKVIEMQYTGFTPYSKKLFLALLARYELKAYRYPRQKWTTVMVRGPQNFLHNVVWAEFLELNKLLQQHLSEITDCIISQNICSAVEEEREVRQLPE
jgi:hypothetical protein